MDAGAAILAWATALEQSAAGDVIRASVWIYPWSNVLHVLG